MASPAEIFLALREALSKADADAAAKLYAPEGVYFEPGDVAHRGPDDIRNYLAADFARRGPVEIVVKREVAAEASVLAEWTSSYTEGGRRWSGTPGVSVLEVGPDGITYHRDYQ